MAFVIEEIPEEDRTKLDPEVFFTGIGLAKRPIETIKWAINRERNIFLVRLGGWGYGGGSKTPDSFALSVDDVVVKFDAFCSAKQKSINDRYNIFWEIVDITPPNLNNLFKDRCFQLIQEGLQAMGNRMCDHENTETVNVEFKQK